MQAIDLIMYSWNKKYFKQVIARKSSLPHALLIKGRAGIGKQDFALDLSHTLLCRQPINAQACGGCPSCNWLAEGNHPDFRLLTPENEDENEESAKKKASKKTQISVAQIRQLFDYLSLSSHQSNGKRIVVISPAEALNIASANALLKMLEEPPANTLFLLVCSQPQRLLPTIVSRCQALDLPIPSKGEAIDWLKAQGVHDAELALDYAGGAPLLALQAQIQSSSSLIHQLAQGVKLDANLTAPMFLSLGMERAIETLQKWVFDLLSMKLTQRFRYHTQQSGALQALSKGVNLRLLMRFEQMLVEAKKTANHPLSNEMQLENILLQYTYIFKT